MTKIYSVEFGSQEHQSVTARDVAEAVRKALQKYHKKWLASPTLKKTAPEPSIQQITFVKLEASA